MALRNERLDIVQMRPLRSRRIHFRHAQFAQYSPRVPRRLTQHFRCAGQGNAISLIVECRQRDAVVLDQSELLLQKRIDLRTVRPMIPDINQIPMQQIVGLDERPQSRTRFRRHLRR